MKQRHAKKQEREENDVLNIGARAESEATLDAQRSTLDGTGTGQAGAGVPSSVERQASSVALERRASSVEPRVPRPGDRVIVLSVSGKREEALVRRVVTPGAAGSVLHLAIFAKEYMGMDDVPKRHPSAPRGWTWDWPEGE